MKELLATFFAFILSLLNFTQTSPAVIDSFEACEEANGSIITLSYPRVCVAKDGKRFVEKINKTVSDKTFCNVNEDCVLMNIEDRNCCGTTGCEDFSTDNWVAVNKDWYKSYSTTCNDGPCPLLQCNQNITDQRLPGRETFVARCVSNVCTKLGGL